MPNSRFPLIIALLCVAFAAYPFGSIIAPEEERSYVIKMNDISQGESVLFLGDIMLGRYVATLIEQRGLSYPFEKLKGLLSSVTHVVANLEGPIPDDYVKTENEGFQFAFPKSATTTLAYGHISAVSLANNHSLDHGDKGYASTVSLLSSSGITAFGASRYVSQTAWKKTMNGIPVVVFGINMITSSWNEVASLNAVRTLCSASKGAYVIAFLHWGDEYARTHITAQETYAKKLFGTCVSAIIGAHPHVIEDVAVYDGKPVFYSLGNAVFDQYFSQDTERELAINATFGDKEIQFEIIPLVSENSQPRLADGDDKKAMLESIAGKSDESLREGIRKGFLRVPYPSGIKKN